MKGLLKMWPNLQDQKYKHSDSCAHLYMRTSVSTLLPGGKQITAVLSLYEHIDLQLCLWTRKRGQAECLQGGPWQPNNNTAWTTWFWQAGAKGKTALGTFSMSALSLILSLSRSEERLCERSVTQGEHRPTSQEWLQQWQLAKLASSV